MVAVLDIYCYYDYDRQKTGLNVELKLPSLEKRLLRGCGYFSGEHSLTWDGKKCLPVSSTLIWSSRLPLILYRFCFSFLTRLYSEVSFLFLVGVSFLGKLFSFSTILEGEMLTPPSFDVAKVAVIFFLRPGDESIASPSSVCYCDYFFDCCFSG